MTTCTESHQLNETALVCCYHYQTNGILQYVNFAIFEMAPFFKIVLYLFLKNSCFCVFREVLMLNPIIVGIHIT